MLMNWNGELQDVSPEDYAYVREFYPTLIVEDDAE